MRKIAAVLTCLLVLTLSISTWTGVCSSMPQGEMALGHHGMTDHEMPMQHSHQGDAPASHCTVASACISLSDSPIEAALVPVSVSAQTVASIAERFPESAARDLETPPPRA